MAHLVADHTLQLYGQSFVAEFVDLNGALRVINVFNNDCGWKIRPQLSKEIIKSDAHILGF